MTWLYESRGGKGADTLPPLQPKKHPIEMNPSTLKNYVPLQNYNDLQEYHKLHQE